MGTAGELPKAEQLQNRKFLEDMTPAEAAQAERLPVGLENKGNTCYMNATMQCLYRIDELRDSLKV
jgi:ubiquitin carboxyl-terminal hydrolase 14